MSDLIGDILFYGLYFGYLIILLLLFKVIKFKINDLKPLNIIVIFFVVFSYIGLLPLYSGSSPYYVNLGVVNKEIIFRMLIYSVYTITIFLIVGSLFEKKLKYNNFITNKCLFKLNIKDKLLLLLSLLFVIIVMFDYITKVDTLAILVLLAQTESDVSVARSSMGNNFTGYHWYSLVMHDILYIITASFFINYLISKKRFDALLFIVTLILNCFSLLMATEKAPIIWLLISLIMIYLILIHKGKFNFKFMIISFFSITLILVVLMSVFMGVENVSDAFLSVIRRAFAGGIAPAYFYLDYIPNNHEYLYGRSFPNPSGILPFEHFRLTVEIMNWRFPGLASKGIVGSSPTVFWAEAYVNFGSIGVIIVPGVMAFYISVIFKLLTKLKYTPVTLAFAIWLIMHFKDLSQSGFSGYFFDMKLIVISLFVLFINYFKCQPINYTKKLSI